MYLKVVFIIKIDNGIVPGGFWVFDKNIIVNDKAFSKTKFFLKSENS